MTVWLAIILNSVLFLIFIIISGYWSCYFIKRIYSLRRHKRREVSCISGYYDKEQLEYNYGTEIWKYTLLLLIIVCEIITCLLCLAVNSYHRFTLLNVINTTVELPYSECMSYNKPALNKVILFYTSVPYLHGISTIGKSAEIFLIVFTIHLMEYLITRLKNIYLVNSRRFLFLTTLLCAVFIMTAFIESLTILSLIFSIIFETIYFCVFIRTSKHFKHALLQRAMECLIQYRSNKRAMRQYRNSKVYINILSCGYLFILVSDIVIVFVSISVSILFFGNCYFPFNLFPSLNYVLQTEEGIASFLEIVEHIVWIGYAISYIGIFVIWFPMLCITIYYWIKPIRECFHSNRNIKYRVSESSLKHYLVYN